MYRILGLGNFGEEFEHTPHNIGREILELFQKNNSDIFLKSRFDKRRKVDIFSGEIWEKKVELLFSQGYINNSGDVFNGVFNKENTEEKKKVIVIYDDIHLPFGKIKISFNRGDGGHNGIKDIVKKLKTKEFIRIRIGVCPLDTQGNCRKPKSGNYLNNYLVYKKVSKKNLEEYQNIANKIENILREILKFDYEKAMNKFN